MIKIPIVKVVLEMDDKNYGTEQYSDFADLHREVVVVYNEHTIEIGVPKESLILDKTLNFVNNVYTHPESSVKAVHITTVYCKEITQ